MSLPEMMDEVFHLGTGVVREDALSGQRFRDLVNMVPRLPYLAAEQTAEMMLLGEMIADRAFLNLPEDAQKLAAQWKSADTADQIQMLNDLQAALVAIKNKYNRHIGPDVVKPFFEALPSSLKPYDGEGTMPNCLGMAQMLIGFARAAGASHILMDTLYQYSTYSEHLNYNGMNVLMSLAAPYRDRRQLNKLVSRMEKFRESVLQTLVSDSNSNQAHHALLIRTNDSWWIVDPYFEVLCESKLPTRRLDTDYAQIYSAPRSCHTYIEERTEDELSARKIVRALQDHIGALGKLDKPLKSWNFASEGLVCIKKAFGTTKEEFLKNSSKIVIASLSAFYSRAEIKRLMAGKDDLDDKLEKGLAKVKKSKRNRNVAFGRLMDHMMSEAWMSILATEPSDQTAPAIYELHHPALQLAVRTVNHLAYHLNTDVPELIQYGRGQWIIHDTLDMVERSGNKRLQQIAARNLRYLEKNPQFVLPRLRPYLTVR